jgi:hypothetical protein
MAIDGQWTLHYGWGCTGNYSQAPITFNNNGTFSNPPYTGKWVQSDGKILFQFDTAKTTYGGNFAGNAMVGAMSTFAGLNGCWYAIRVGSTITKAEEAELDASGAKTKQ